MGRLTRSLRLQLAAFSAILASVFVRAFLTVTGFPTGHWYVLTLGFGIFCLTAVRTDLLSLPRKKALLLATGLLAFLTFLGMPYTSRDYFLLDFNRVRNGMTRAQVEGVMQRYLSGTGIPNIAGVKNIQDGTSAYEVDQCSPELSPRGCQVYRHSNDAAWNADWSTVCYQDGVVVSTKFSPD